MMTLDEFKDTINRISDEKWEHIKSASEEAINRSNIKDTEWWNIKFYKNNPPNDGEAKQDPLKGTPEIPYQRKIFYPSGEKSDKRFCPKNISVGYFSSNFAITCCEKIEELKENNNCSWKEHLKPYLCGISNSDPTSYGYPLIFKLVDSSAILDLRKGEATLQEFDEISENKASITQLIYLSNKYEYSCLLAGISYEKGFKGILYSSVREPNDINLCGYNLVVFDETKITKWSAKAV